jgi:hypothetical protein
VQQPTQDPIQTAERAQALRMRRAEKFGAISIAAGFFSLLLPVWIPNAIVAYFALLLTAVGLGTGGVAIVAGHRHWIPLLLGAIGFCLSLMFPVLLILFIVRVS